MSSRTASQAGRLPWMSARIATRILWASYPGVAPTRFQGPPDAWREGQGRRGSAPEQAPACWDAEYEVSALVVRSPPGPAPTPSFKYRQVLPRRLVGPSASTISV